jgi:hypothetical protein
MAAALRRHGPAGLAGPRQAPCVRSWRAAPALRASNREESAVDASIDALDALGIGEGARAAGTARALSRRAACAPGSRPAAPRPAPSTASPSARAAREATRGPRHRSAHRRCRRASLRRPAAAAPLLPSRRRRQHLRAAAR